MPPGFQPSGRPPAPPPLDLVQAFANTEIPVWGVDDVATPAALAEWLHSHALVSGDVLVDASAFVRARELRAVLRELAKRNTRRTAPDEQLRARFEAIAADARLRLGLGEDGALGLVPEVGGVEGALATILARVFEAQSSGRWRRLKSCPGPHCGWLFYDASRNSSSIWCSMSICGNRTKTAEYRRRRSAG